MFSKSGISRLLALPLTLAAILSFAVTVSAAGKHAGTHHHGPSIGNPGQASSVTRTIEILMIDNAFQPDSITVKKGETVRFVVINKGKLVHEFNIGTAAMHAAHQEEMMEMADKGILEADRINHHMMKSGSGGHGMAHDDPNSALLEPGASSEIIWKFDADADLQMACNVPGHYEAGMVGNIALN